MIQSTRKRGKEGIIISQPPTLLECKKHIPPLGSSKNHIQHISEHDGLCVSSLQEIWSPRISIPLMPRMS